MPNKIKSQVQAGFLGAVASGSMKKAGLTPAKARNILRDNAGFKMRDLPARAPGARKPRRVSTRGRR